MAHKSFAMPLLKLTKRPTREKKEVEYLHKEYRVQIDPLPVSSTTKSYSSLSPMTFLFSPLGVKFSCLMRICPFSRLLRESQHLMR